MSGQDKENLKDKYVAEVIASLVEKGFEQTLKEKEQQDFMKMISATYYTGETNDEQTLEYIADIVDEQDKKKLVIDTMRSIKHTYELQAKNKLKAQKEKKRQAPRERPEQKGDQVKKKTKVDTNPKQEGDQQKEEKIPGQHKGLKQQLQVQGKTKCKFFPFCKNPQSCQFYHPTQKCTYFPHCRFGESCLYQHQICRYKEKCSKYGCPYDHPFKKASNPLQAVLKSIMGGSKNGNNPFNKNMAPKKKKPYVPYVPKTQQKQQEQ